MPYLLIESTKSNTLVRTFLDSASLFTSKAMWTRRQFSLTSLPRFRAFRASFFRKLRAKTVFSLEDAGDEIHSFSIRTLTRTEQ